MAVTRQRDVRNLAASDPIRAHDEAPALEVEEFTLFVPTLFKPARRRKAHRIVVAFAVAMTTAAAITATAVPASAHIATTVRGPRDPVGLCPPVPNPPVPLYSGSPQQLPYYNVFGDYGVFNHNNYWSILATQGNQYINSDVSLLRNTICGPTSDLPDPLALDWVAVDSNAGRVPTGSFVARFSGSRDAGTLAEPIAQFVDGHEVLSTTTPYTAQRIGDEFSNWIVDIRDMYLYAGQNVRLAFSGPVTELHVVGSDPARRSTWYRTPTSTLGSRYFPNPPQNAQDASLEVTAPWSGWYGVVVGRPYGATTATVLYVTTL